MKIIIVSIVIFVVLFFCAAFKLSKREDGWAEKRYNEYIKSKNKDNNN